MKGISRGLSPTRKRKDSPMQRARKGIEEIKNLFNLHGKVAVVTGGAGALGKAVSIGLAAYGVDLVVVDLEEAALDGLSGKIREMGRKALPVSCDITDPDRVDQMVRLPSINLERSISSLTPQALRSVSQLSKWR